MHWNVPPDALPGSATFVLFWTAGLTTALRNRAIELIRGDPERAPNTRGTGSGFICIYIIYIIVCLWGDHFSEEIVKF